ncbi:response regulator [Massilia orientalis]|uniref:Response regulator n=1 Tax=Massilia orientalis TaxID=3050128 RepID=A0ACC7MF33_9BURK|nr:response regulator [Massilia sp. YIM B02787]
MIIDDNADAATLLAMFIGFHGHDTAVAHSGAEGLALASTFAPEVVLLDLGMPEMSGYDVAIALRKLPGLACTYIAALTGWNDAQTRARVVASGFDKHLVKPPDVGVVLDLMDTCGRSHARSRCA